MSRSVADTAVERVRVPAAGHLSAWSAYDWAAGVHVGELSALECLRVITENSTYDLILLSPDTADVLVRGGAFFPVFMPARVAGSTLGGSFLKLHTVHVGFRLELTTDRGFVVTSRVRRVERVPDSTDPADLM